jgi:hypothetical protein
MRKFKIKICEVCKKEYQPTGTRQSKCKKCSPKLNGTDAVRYHKKSGSEISRTKANLYDFKMNPDVDDISWA